MLDTNICIYLMRHQPPSVAERFAQCRRGDVVISTITLAELEYGVHRCSPSSKLQNRLALDALVDRIPAVPFDRAASNHYAEIRAALPDRRRDALDRLIASHARSLNVVLVTNNLADFRFYPGVQLENWVGEAT